MKKLAEIWFLLPLLSLFFATSCEEDLDYKGIESPVVFALLDKADSIHYVKITHSIPGNVNAIEVAQDADASYYKELDVKIEEWVPISANGENMVKTRSWTLKDTVITNKAPGTFYAQDQKVYYFKTDVYNSSSVPDDFDTTSTVALKQIATYKLVAVANGGEYTINSETPLVEMFHMTVPTSASSLSFVNYTSNSVTYVNYHPSAQFSNNSNSPNIFNARMKVYFNEFFNGIPAEKSFEINFGQKMGDEISATGVSFEGNGKTFYELIKSNSTNDPNINKRQLEKIEMTMAGGSKVLSDYIVSNQPLASALIHVKDSYTNITCSDGRKAVGIFTSTYTSVLTKPDWLPGTPANRAINSNSVKVLCTGGITGSLLFCSDNPLDANLSFSCQ